MLLFDRPNGSSKNWRSSAAGVVTKMMMEPSGGVRRKRIGASSSSSSSSSFSTQPLLASAEASSFSWESSGEEEEEEAPRRIGSVGPVPHPDEPNLYRFPASFQPSYRPLPLVPRIAVTLLSSFVSLATTWKAWQIRAWLLQTMRAPVLNSSQTTWPPALSWSSLLYPGLVPFLRRLPWKKLVEAAAKVYLLTRFSTVILQERFWPCTRVSTPELAQRFHLPSPLSRYQPVVHNNNGTSSTHHGVHWLEYKNNSTDNISVTDPSFDAIYVNHGFGASSLSWLPALPALVQQTNAAVGLGHDAPGFGFTDRPDHLRDYSLAASANIGSALLLRRCNVTNSVLLLGHSMGALTTLRMALQLTDVPKQRIILVAPALGLRRTRSRSVRKETQTKGRTRGVVVPTVACFLLRRLVGSPNFWRKGLRTVWGNPSRVSDSDVLRFQWPAVGQGWERGLFNFARAQQLPHVRYHESDEELLQQVLDMPNVSGVDVIVGTKDRVVPLRQVQKFLKDFSSVRVTELEGLGHDPFEEDVEGFVQTVELLLSSKPTRIDSKM
jgi:pimeloyl-ACP methyl ester carboxylesterase